VSLQRNDQTQRAQQTDLKAQTTREKRGKALTIGQKPSLSGRRVPQDVQDKAPPNFPARLRKITELLDLGPLSRSLR
jgi:hypothetical protein